MNVTPRITVPSSATSRLALVSTRHVWTFADLVLRRVRVRWENAQDGSDSGMESRPTLLPVSDGGH